MRPPLRPFMQASFTAKLTPFHTSPCLLPIFHAQHRRASILSSISDNPGAYKKRIRVGRGPASGKGKTSGRGHKGQKQHGKVPRGFNGGQTPLEIVKGIRGFVNPFSEDLVPLNLDRLQSWIDQGRIDPRRPITVKELADSRCATNIKDGVKLLARGSTQIRSPLHIIVSRASTSAIAAIEAAGGTITTRYYTRFAIQRILRGKTDPANSLLTRDHVPVLMVGQSGSKVGFLNRLPDPTSRKDIEYYRNPAHRGYLSYQVQEGDGPSLFHKPPKDVKQQPKKGHEAKISAADNRIW